METHSFQKLNLKHRSELNLLKDEIVFLQQFLKTNFSTMFSIVSVSRVQLLYDRLVQFQFAHGFVSQTVEMYQQNQQSKTVEFLKMEAERNAERIEDLVRIFNTIKKEIFAFYKDSTERNSNIVSTELQLN